MTKVKVAVSAASFAKNQTLVAELHGLGLAVALNDRGRVLTEAELVSFFADAEAEVAIVGTEPITAELLDRCPRLRFIAKYGVGLDNIDEPELARRGIGLGWSGGVNKRAVSELVLAFMLGHWRNVIPSIARMREGRWVKDGGRQLCDLTVGIIGLGHVGSDLARLLQPFGCNLVFTDLADKSVEAAAVGARALPYQELIRIADVLTFHVPATPLTKRMFGPAELLHIKPTALVINTSRGSVVEFPATCAAVVEGKLGGFAADVFPAEPCDLTCWADCERLYFTPHIGGNSQEAVLAMGRAAIRHVQAFAGNALG